METAGKLPMRECAYVNCKRGPGGSRARFRPVKPWGLYCCRECGDVVRRLRYYYRKKNEG